MTFRREILAEGVEVYLGDCLEVLPTLGKFDACVTDPPYGMKKAAWDHEIPNWLPMLPETPTVCFSGVLGLHDYRRPDWTGAWVRLASTQRNGRLRGFNNWEPLLFFNISHLDNDVIVEPNLHEDTGHPTTKPTGLMIKLVEKMPGRSVVDPFMGSGTTGIAAVKLGRSFTGIELDQGHFDTACRRITAALREPDMFIATPKLAKQLSILDGDAA